MTNTMTYSTYGCTHSLGIPKKILVNVLRILLVINKSQFNFLLLDTSVLNFGYKLLSVYPLAN
jgi:hypothetical protein